MDSTFLGVLAGFGMKLNQTARAAGQRHRTATMPPRAWRELLENLGAAHLFKMTSGPLQLPGDVETCTPESINPTHEEITRTSLEAHQTLHGDEPGKRRAVQGCGPVSGRGFEELGKSK